MYIVKLVVRREKKKRGGTYEVTEVTYKQFLSEYLAKEFIKKQENRSPWESVYGNKNYLTKAETYKKINN
tara:strand:+ start:833 stop:1042 length:210 start_codon:yes stop_codon:yes gene_type:complete